MKSFFCPISGKINLNTLFWSVDKLDNLCSLKRVSAILNVNNVKHSSCGELRTLGKMLVDRIARKS
jgi:hypothetical protein